MRGVFEGDGCLCYSSAEGRWHLYWAGTHQVMNMLRSILAEHTSAKHDAKGSLALQKGFTWRLRYGGGDSIAAIAYWMYKDASALCVLDRKAAFADCSIRKIPPTEFSNEGRIWKQHHEGQISTGSVRETETERFVWNMPPPSPFVYTRKYQQRAGWAEKFMLLQSYKAKHGNCLIPVRHVTTTGVKLGNWVRDQRTARRKNRIDPERERRLESEGFVWNPPTGRRLQPSSSSLD